MRISDWSSDVCSSDLGAVANLRGRELRAGADADLRHPLPPVPAAGRDRRPLPRAGRRIGDRRMTGTLPIKQAATGVALILAIAAPWPLSSGARRVGEACVSTCRARCSPDQYTKHQTLKTHNNL